MTYVLGSRTSVTGAPAEDLRTLIEAELTAHPNWDQVDPLREFPAGTAWWSVWRCGAANSTGVPYYVLLGRSVNYTERLFAAVAETYDAVAHTFKKAAPAQPSGTSYTPAADGTYGGDTAYALIDPSTTAAAGYPMFRQPAYAAAAAYDYRIAVNNDALMVSTSYPTLSGFLVSTFDSLVANAAVDDPMPLIISALTASSTVTGTTYASTTRHPLVTTAKQRLWGVGSVHDSSNVHLWPAAGMVGAAGGTGDLFQGGMPVGVRGSIRTWGAIYNPSVEAAGLGMVRGLYRHVLALTPASGVVAGDTITMGADTYVYLGYGNAWYNTSVA